MYFLDLLGTFAFAIGGAYKAKERKLNIFGVIFLGIITAVGGGTIRDLIIDRAPLFYLRDPMYLIVCFVAGGLTFYLPNFFKKTYSVFRLSDSIGLATFVIIGASVTSEQIFPVVSPSLISIFSCVLMGMVTGFGGGVIRDAIMGDTPYSLKAGSNYIMSAFWGAFIYYMVSFINPYLAIILSMFTTLALREIISEYGIYNKVISKRLS